jgi:hypothetical protein
VLIASVGYDAQELALELELTSGAVYRYYEVPEIVHRRLLAAASLGAFFNAEIRDAYRCAEITRD